MAAPRASVVLSTGSGERGAGWRREGDRGRVRRATPSNRCRGCCSGAGGDLREAAGLRRVLPGPRLPTGRRRGARLAVAGQLGQRGLPPGVPGLRLQARARPPRRAGAARPAGKDAVSEISDVFLLLPGAARDFRDEARERELQPDRGSAPGAGRMLRARVPAGNRVQNGPVEV